MSARGPAPALSLSLALALALARSRAGLPVAVHVAVQQPLLVRQRQPMMLSAQPLGVFELSIASASAAFSLVFHCAVRRRLSPPSPCVSVCSALSVCPSARASICLHVCLSACLLVCSVYVLSVRRSVGEPPALSAAGSLWLALNVALPQTSQRCGCHGVARAMAGSWESACRLHQGETQLGWSLDGFLRILRTGL